MDANRQLARAVPAVLPSGFRFVGFWLLLAAAACVQRAWAGNPPPICQVDPCSILCINCDDGNACTSDGCIQDGDSAYCVNPPIICTPPPCFSGACVNGDCVYTWLCGPPPPCGSVACINGACVTFQGCDDNDPCTTDTCVNGMCVHDTNCGEDGDPCTVDWMDVNCGCHHDPVVCEDIPCTTWECVNGGCVYTSTCPSTGDPCIVAFCDNGVCNTQPTDCSDDNPCTINEHCDPATGNCLADWNCPPPQDPCLQRWCNAQGNCENIPVDCNDNSPCTTDPPCDPQHGCVHQWTCEDNNPCTVEVCVNGECRNQLICPQDTLCINYCCVVVSATSAYCAQDAYAQQPDLVASEPDPVTCPGTTIAVHRNLCNLGNCPETFTWAIVATGTGVTVTPQQPFPNVFLQPSPPCQELTALVTIPPDFAETIELHWTATSTSDGTCGPLVTLTDTATSTVTVLRIDLDVDSDNTNNLADFGPQRGQAEELIEDQAGLPGKYVTVNDESDDGDIVTDYGDGYNLDGVATNADDSNAMENDFVRMVLELPAPIDLALARVRFSYEASDPAGATVAGAPPVVTPAPGRLRIWTKNGNAIRNAAKINASPPGDYVAPDTYTPANFGLTDTMRTVSLWIEGIRPSPSLGGDRILVEVDPDGDGPQGFQCSDAVRVTVIRIDLDIDSDNTNGIGAPDRSDAEDVIEDYLLTPAIPAKYLRVNRDNDDDPEPYGDSATVHERIDDFADGYNRDGLPGVPGTDDDVNPAEDDFTPLVLEIPAPVNLNFARLIFSYSASDPAALVISDAMPQYNAPNRRKITLPAKGKLRIWTRPGTDARNPASVIGAHPGHFVPSTVPILAGELGLSNTMRTMTLYVEGIAASTGIGQQRIEVLVDPDGTGPAAFIVSDAVRLTVVDVQFDKVADNKGFDHTINPRGLMVPLPLGGANTVAVTISPAVELRCFSTVPAVAVVPQDPHSSDFQLPVVSVAAGLANVEARIDTPDAFVAAALRAAVLPPKNIQVKFHQVSDSAGGGNPAHMSARGAAQAQALLDAMNACWNPQANVFFQPAVANFVADVIPVNLGAVVQYYDGGGPPPLPCTQSAAADWKRVVANEDAGVPYDVFFVWEYEQDCSPDEDPTMDSTEAATPPGLTLIDDATCDDGFVMKHEPAHHINPTNPHFNHPYAGNPDPVDPNGDWSLYHNLMLACHPAYVHLTVRQARISNSSVP